MESMPDFLSLSKPTKVNYYGIPTFGRDQKDNWSKNKMFTSSSYIRHMQNGLTILSIKLKAGFIPLAVDSL